MTNTPIQWRRNGMNHVINRLGYTRLCEVGVRDGHNLRRNFLSTDATEIVAVDMWRDDGVISRTEGMDADRMEANYQAILQLADTDSRLSCGPRRGVT